MIALDPKPLHYPGACARCGQNRVEGGPYLNCDYENAAGQHVYYCRTCIPELIRPLEVVPAAQFAEACEAQAAAEKRARGLEADAKRIEAERARLARQLDDALTAKANAEASQEIMRNRIRDLEASPAVAAKEALLAQLAQRPEPTRRRRAAA